MTAAAATMVEEAGPFAFSPPPPPPSTLTLIMAVAVIRFGPVPAEVLAPALMAVVVAVAAYTLLSPSETPSLTCSGRFQKKEKGKKKDLVK